MVRHLLMLALAAAAVAACGARDEAGGNEAAAGNAQREPSDGAASRQAERTIGETIGQTAELSRFAEALQAAGLAETFRGAEPYTVFAPVNAAFDALPQETRARLMAAGGREQLTQLLTYHVVPGVVTSQDLAHAMERGHGRATLATIAGRNITVTREGDALYVADAAGARARIGQADRRQSNGVIHQIDAVLMPAGEAAAQ